MKAEKLKQANDSTEFENGSKSKGAAEEKREADITQALAELGEPLLSNDIDAPEVPEGFLPSPFKEYAIAVRENTQTPKGAAALLMLAILATCLQKKFVVAPYDDNYIESLVKWILIVLPPGERKTAILMALLAPIAEWEREKAAELEDKINKNKVTREITQGRIDALKTKAIKSADPDEQSKAEAEIADLIKNMPDELRAPQKYTGSITPESLEDLLVKQNEAMSILSDEGDGQFEIITGLYSDGKSNIDVFLKGHAGSPHKVKRLKREADLKAPAVTMGITIQPDVIERLGVGNKRKLRGIGALARIDYYWPKGMIGHRQPRKRISIPKDIEQAYFTAIKSLLDIPIPETPARLVLADDAQEEFTIFQEWLEPSMAPFEDYGEIADWASKTAGGAIRTAAILHAAKHKGANTAIPIETVKNAVMVNKKLLVHAMKALGILGLNPVIADAKWALAWILQKAKQDTHGRWFFKENDLHLANRFKNDTKDRLNEALDILHGWSAVTKTVKLDTRKPTLLRYISEALFANDNKIKSTLSTLSSLSKELENEITLAEVTL